MLEEKIEKIRSWKGKIAVPLISVGLALSSMYCGSEGPSEECCNELQQCDIGHGKICDGNGDACYCRDRTCCDDVDCGGGGAECVTEHGHCYCTDSGKK